MLQIKKDQIIPEEHIVFVVGNKIVNKYIVAGDDINIKKINKNKVHVSFSHRKKISILNSVFKLDAISMRRDGIDIRKNNLANCPNIIFKGKCCNVCQFEIIDDMQINQCLH